MIRLTRNRITILILSLLPIFALNVSSADESSAPASVPDSKKVSAWLSGVSRTYDEWFVQRKDVFTKDPYIWVYNQTFAQDFGMPDRWVDSSLSGADALAFRTGMGFPLCGWGRKVTACNVNHECILEMYFNRRSNVLPWSDRVRWTDLQIGQTSISTLSSLRPIDRAESVNIGPRSPFSEPDNGAELFWWYEYETKGMSGGAAHVTSYDKSAFKNYSVVILSVSCIRQEYSGLQLRANPKAGQRGEPILSVNFPKAWRERIRPAMNAVVEKEGSFFKEKFEELKNSNN